MRCLLLLLVVIGGSGCGRNEEPEFEGKPLSEWVAQAQGKDRPLRLAAYEGLGAFPQDRVATRTLEEVLNNDGASTAERLAAGKNLFRVTGDADRVINPVRAIIRREADAAAGFQATREVEELAFWLGGRAKPLIPDLQYARDKIPAKDLASKRRREAIEKIANGIPKA